MKICICGGGSLGHVCAGVLSSTPDVQLNILSGHPDRWGKSLTVTDCEGKQYTARIHQVSSNPAEVAVEQDIILLCLPGYLLEKTLCTLAPYIGSAAVGTIVSSTGFFYFAHDLLPEGTKLFGFQRVPYISRVAEYGHTARLLGYKTQLAVATEGIGEREAFREILETLFLTPVTLLQSIHEASLSNSNPILHTGRLYSMFHGKEHYLFDHNILFYKEWTDDASELLINMDAEFFKLLGVLGIKSLQTLLEYYESTDAASLTRKIASILAFQTITSPMVQVDGGWKVDFTSRYFTEDFPFGLRWIKQLSEQHNINTPYIDKVYTWGMDGLKLNN